MYAAEMVILFYGTLIHPSNHPSIRFEETNWVSTRLRIR